MIVRVPRGRIRIGGVALMSVMILTLTGACDAEGGPRYRIVNESSLAVRVYIDELPLTYADVNGRLVRQFTTFSHDIDSFDPNESGWKRLGYVQGLPPKTLLVVTAVTNDTDIVYQRTITLEELEDAVITIIME